MLNIILCGREFYLNIFDASCNFCKRVKKESGAFSLNESFYFSDEAIVAFSVEEFVICHIHSLFLFCEGACLWHADPSLKVCSTFQCCYFILAVGFRRKEFRGKLAIAITANFINRNTTAEAKVEEISGVAFIFNQKFFQDLREATGLPAIARFPVKTICLCYYNFNSGIMFNQ